MAFHRYMLLYTIQQMYRLQYGRMVWVGTALRLCTECTYYLGDRLRLGEDTLVSLVSDIECRLQHGDMYKYMTVRGEKVLSVAVWGHVWD